MKIPLICIGAVLLSCSGVLARADDPKETKEYRDGYKQGIAEAEKELKEGHPTLYMSGLQMSFEHLDKKTGLRMTPIAACVVDDRTDGREHGHNKRIMDHIKIHGLPASSFKKWERELFDLRAFFDDQTKTNKPVRLEVGGPKHVSPDGKFTVTPVQSHIEKDDGTSKPVLGIVVTARGQKPMREESIWQGDESDFVWGPEGSRFIVIRCRGNGVYYMAFDLECSEWLRWDLN